MHHRPRIRQLAGGMLAGTLVAGVLAAAPAHPAAAREPAPAPGPAATGRLDEAWAGQGQSFTSTERLDGTYANPITASDVPDVSTIRVSAEDAGEPRDVYYMVSTTMELSPGVAILKSYDLVNWDLASYVWDVLETTDDAALRNGRSSYGQGQWASTIAFHDGRYYVIHNSNNTGRSYLFSTDDIESGEWSRHTYPAADRFHDPNLYFDGDTPYVFYGATQTDAVRLSPDLTTVEQRFTGVITKANFTNESGYTRDEVAPNGWEGFQLTKVGDWYYALAISFGKFGRQTNVFRSRTLLGAADPTSPEPYAGKIAIGTKSIAQGNLVSTGPEGSPPDQALVFADYFPTGRVPVLVPVRWDEQDPDAWPSFGAPGTQAGDAAQVEFPGTVPVPVELPADLRRRAMASEIVASDDFDDDADPRDYNNPTPGPTPEPVDPGAPVGTEVVTNGGFEDADVIPWTAREGATLTSVTTGAATGTTALQVTGRTSTGSGVQQALDVDPGSTYRVSFKVRTDDEAAAATTTFIASADYGAAGPAGQARWVNLASGSVAKGQWTTITGTYVAPTDRPVDQLQLYVENPYAAAPTAAQRPSYVLDDVSVVKTAAPGAVWSPEEDADNGSHLAMPWQWNHNPDNRFWSLTDRPGWLRLETGSVTTGTASAQFNLTRFEEARNTLSQRTFGPTSSAEVKLDVSQLAEGDTTGLAVYNRQLSYIGVRDVDGVRTLGIVNRAVPPGGFQRTTPAAGVEDFLQSVPLAEGTDEVWLKADFDLRKGGPTETRDRVQFLYSLDGATWQPLGGPQQKLTGFEGSHFKGQRFGIFHYATETAGGIVDVDYYALSDVLTSQGLPVDTTDLDWLLAEADGLDAADWTPQTWADVEDAVADARAVAEGEPSTQNQVDAVAVPLNRAIAFLAAVDAPVPAPTVVSAAAPGQTYGRAATLRVTVAGADGGRVEARLPGGRVLSAEVAPSGVARVVVPARALRPGTRSVRVDYLGTATAQPSSGTVSVRVAKAPTRLRVTVARAVRAGRTLVVRTEATATGLVPQGRVRVRLAGRPGATVAPLRGGGAVVRVAVPRRTPPGPARLTVRYAGSDVSLTAAAQRTVRVTRP